MSISQKSLVISVLTLSLASSLQLDAMKRQRPDDAPEHNAPLAPNQVLNRLSLPQTYHMFFEQFTLAAETYQTFPELVQHIMQFHYHSDPTAFAKDLWIIVTNMEQEVMQARFNRLKDHPESLLKMALRLKYAQKFDKKIPGDELNAVDFVQNYGHYGVNSVKFRFTDLFKQPYLKHVLPLLELLIGKPVTALDLSNNKLTKLPESIDNLVNLKVLDLHNNQLTVLPESIGNLVNLKKLWLHNNQLTVLPESIGNLVNLEVLWLDSNQLKEVPKAIGKLVNLKTLWLHNNQLTQNTKDWLLQQFSDLGDYLRLD